MSPSTDLRESREFASEIKYMVEEFALNPQPVSKYRLAATVLGWVATTSTADSHEILPPQYA